MQKLLLVVFLILAPWVLWAQGSVVLEGELYRFDKDNNTLYYTNPRATFDKAILMANNLVYKKDQGLLEFDGNILVRSPEFLITAERGNYNLQTKEMTFEEVSLYDYVNLTYLRAKKVVKVDAEIFDIFDAKLTLCSPEDPAWAFESDYIRYDIDNFAYSVNTLLLFNDLPIFYTPIASWPTKKGRATGFLAPVISSKRGNVDKGKNYGARAQLPYFIAFDKDHDLTVTPDQIEKRGTGLGLEYAYAFVPGMSGLIKTWYLDESKTDRDLTFENLGSKTADQVDLRPTRYNYSFDHRQNIPWGGQLFLHQTGRSDNELEKEYLDLLIGQQPRLARSASVVLPWEGGGLNITHEKGDQFLYPSVFDRGTDLDTHLNRNLVVTANKRFSGVGGTALSLATSGGWTDFERRYGWRGGLSQGSLEGQFPFNLDFLNLIPFYRADVYQYSPNYAFSPGETSTSGFEAKPQAFGWVLGKKRIEANFELFKVFADQKGIGRSRLGLRPKLIYEEVDDIDQRKGLALTPSNHVFTPDNFDPMATSRFADYSRWAPMFSAPIYGYRVFTFRWEANYLIKNPLNQQVRSLFNLAISDPYNLNREQTLAQINAKYLGPQIPEALQETSLGNRRMPLKIELGLNPSESFSTGLFYRFDHELGRVIENRYSVGAASFEGHRLDLGYTNNTKAYMELDGINRAASKSYTLNQLLQLGNRSSLNFNGQWDLSRAEPALLYGTLSDVERLDRQLTFAKLELHLGHQCFDYILGFTEQVVTRTQNNRNFETVEQVFSASMNLAKWPSSVNPYQRKMDINRF
ncbi:MAG: hypothetical protein A2527_13905 [Candidatus Lambdaproteobacteria bacterium RIFOXYD2_FULL_50_16]|uniref:LPS-assembly protein LptD n=1 Tax=Candidatus Lambdaproteobacteria bacterium RIFOXYD2_FULL_50_16 TaxID=1817772 RepID=A0A1F6G4I8_9PROT|nr:MAG: hypothetical protein A2527_13905 [Candidatus Lambdaproteobacteria bacterium RIFOXYD2_FULL_50_16]